MIRVNHILVYTLVFDCYIQSGWTYSLVYSGLLETSDPIIKCPTKGILRHVMPGSRCRRHYMCRDGTIVKQSCPVGTIFSFSHKRCKAEGKCYELVCVGRRDGLYSDNSTGGARIFKCSGGRLVEIINMLINGPEVNSPVDTAEAAFTFRLQSACKDKSDGYHPLTPAHDSGSDCSVYVRCNDGDDIEVKTCPVGQFFDGHRCSSSVKPCRDPCWGRGDGRHADDTVSCSGYFECERGKTTGTHKCPPGTTFDGRTCSFHVRSSECSPNGGMNYCLGLTDGAYPDIKDETYRRYVECFGGKMTIKFCSEGQTWNGTGCSKNPIVCSRTQSLECIGRQGYFTAHNRDCNEFTFCHSGLKIAYSCRPGMRFNGRHCAPKRTVECPLPEENSCESKPAGYYVDVESNCRAYFYCGAGPNKITYVCPPNQVFDGEQCVLPSTYRCSSTSGDNDECSTRTDGYHRRRQRPQEYIYCQDGVKHITLKCHEHHELDAMRGCMPV